MQREELLLAIQQICDEKGLTLEEVKATIEEALAAAFRKDFGDKKTQNIKVEFDLASGDFKVFDVKEVVEDELKEKYEKIKAEIEKLKAEGKEITEELMAEIQGKPEDEKQRDREVEKQKEELKKIETDEANKNEEIPAEKNAAEIEAVEEEKKFNPRTMISLTEAKAEDKKKKIGDVVIKELEVPAEFGRMAAQTAKQVIIQKLREAERSNLFNKYKDKIGELIVGTVQRQEGRIILIDLGDAQAVMPPMDQTRREDYRSGARMKFYLKTIEQTNRGPEIIVSRAHPEMLRKLFKLEVPEINNGTVQIKVLARDPGFRAKVAVMSKDEDLDPIGACIGQRGTRVQAIINELNGEKIDIIEWSEDEEKFIINALAPAKVLRVAIEENETGKLAKAYVKEDQYSLAIGKEGQNVRLAAQLAGMKIEVVMEEKAGEPKKTESAEESNEDKVVTESDEKEIENQKSASPADGSEIKEEKKKKKKSKETQKDEKEKVVEVQQKAGEDMENTEIKPDVA